MSCVLTETEIDQWRLLWEEMKTDAEWMSFHEERDAKRRVVQEQIVDLTRRFLSGKIGTEELRETFDRKTRTDWDVFGVKGLSGAMFLNKLVKHIADQQALTSQLRDVLQCPPSVHEGRQRMETFLRFQTDVIQSSQVTKGQLQPARTPFFVSAMWHFQAPEQWPIFYISGRRALESQGIYSPTRNPVAAYFAFRECFLSLAKALSLQSWELEHLFAWQDQQRPHRDDETIVEIEKPAATFRDDGRAVDEGEQEDIDLDHTQVQWLLARIGKKLGCRIWIAANDQNKEYRDQRLGDLSITQLPALGLDSESQRVVSLIDVLWLRGHKQVVAAFEVEHTTSVYSGLLRMSDLAALSPNLSFPLYIVAPENRLDKVRRELSRPTFQALELHKRCGFFSFESLGREAESMMRWASDPSAIDKLAEKVDDVID